MSSSLGLISCRSSSRFFVVAGSQAGQIAAAKAADRPDPRRARREAGQRAGADLASDCRDQERAARPGSRRQDGRREQAYLCTSFALRSFACEGGRVAGRAACRRRTCWRLHGVWRCRSCVCRKTRNSSTLRTCARLAPAWPSAPFSTWIFRRPRRERARAGGGRAGGGRAGDGRAGQRKCDSDRRLFVRNDFVDARRFKCKATTSRGRRSTSSK